MIELVIALVLMQDDCTECHEEEKKAYAGSEHAKEKTACTDCHGEDDASEEREEMGFEAHAREKTFIGVPKDIVIMCARCHDRESRPFRRSLHYEKVEEGCLACHDGHTTREASFARIKASCLQCHEPDTAHYKWVSRIVTLGKIEERLKAELREGGEDRLTKASKKLEELKRQYHAMDPTFLIAALDEIEGLLKEEPAKAPGATEPPAATFSLLAIVVLGIGALLGGAVVIGFLVFQIRHKA